LADQVLLTIAPPDFIYRLVARFISRLVFFSLPCAPPASTPFPYTTLFRSLPSSRSGPCSRSRRHPLPPRPLRLRPRRRRPSPRRDRKSTRLNSSHQIISYAVFCLKKKTGPHCSDRRRPAAARRDWRRGASE